MANVSKWFGFGKNEDYDRGLRAFEADDYPTAIEALESCRRQVSDPTTLRQAEHYLAEARARYGLALLKADQPEEAIAQFKAALVTHPEYPDLHLHLSLAYRRLGQTELQRHSLDRALELNPRYAAATLHRGLLEFQSGNFDEGLENIGKAIDYDPGLNRQRYEFAMECHRKGDTSRTIAALESLGAAEDDDANFHARIADSFAKKHLYSEAISEYAKAIAISPEYADIRCRLGQIYLETDEPALAVREFEAALSTNPQYVEALAGKGIALRRLGRNTEARAQFEEVLNFDPHHAIALVELNRSGFR
ncbi:MAG: Lipopolysaccharide assembly protein B [Fimbriimonadaceae bacterium]|nr:Lipopolysaccharide assembly protein B [Fimbriimonadaceae bacterium]